MKIVINACFGGFSLSPEATLEVWRRGGKIKATPIAEYYGATADHAVLGKNAGLRAWREYVAAPKSQRQSSLFVTVFSPDESVVLGDTPDDRSDPILVQVVEEMGDAANGSCARLRVVEVPDDADWEISEYDGNEHVAEKHRTWA